MISRMRWTAALCALGLSGSASADILEERIATGSNLFVPSPFPLNPAGNSSNFTVLGLEQYKSDEKVKFIRNPGNNQDEIESNTTKKDIVVGGQYALGGGAALGLQYGELQKNVTVKNINRSNANHEHFHNRDYRLKFLVDLLPELRGAFSFHYTALQAELDGSFDIGREDRTRYKGSVSGYGLGLYYQARIFGFGAFHHAPMRGKAMVEGEQKIISEPGIYGLSADLKPNNRLGLSFKANGWSYKHDERDDPATSPANQRGILLRGLELKQFFRKTLAYTVAGEFALTPMIFLKGGYTQQQGVFLFNADKLPGDDKDDETRVGHRQLDAGVAIKSKDFIAEAGLAYGSGSEGRIAAGSNNNGWGNIGDYEASSTALMLMVGAAF